MDRIVHNVATGEITTVPLTDEEIAEAETIQIENLWKGLRVKRDSLLAASDWTVLSDSPTSTAAWKTYRQALRDLPANTTDPSNPVWPTPPS